MGVVEGLEIPPSVEGLETPASVVESLTIDEPLPQPSDDVQTIEEARTVIKQLRERCRFQTHQTLFWRKKAKLQEERLGKMSVDYGRRLESLTSDLLLFESRLSRKQRAIGELLEQRECVVERQQHVIRFLRSRLADFGVTVTTGTGSAADRTTPDDGNVDDSDSAVIMEEDESGNSQEDASERQQQASTDASTTTATASSSSSDGGSVTDGRPKRSPTATVDGRTGENATTATAYNRVMSNHRSVTKPKDVKYKRINKAKSKSLEELRGRLKNWVDRGQRMSLTVDPTYG